MRIAITGTIIQDNQLLLVRKKQTWIFPGGKPLFNETDIGCLIREFHEELPLLRIYNPRYYNEFCGKTPHMGDTIRARAYFLDCSGDINSSAEISESRWFDLSDLVKYQVSDISLKIIDSLKLDGYLEYERQ